MIQRPYTHADEKRVVDLLNICFPDKHISGVSFFWKHFDPYFKHQSLAYLAEDRGMIVSFVCFVPVTLSDNGDTHRIYSCAIQATHPQYRRKGFVSALTEKIEQLSGKNAHYFGFSNENGINIDRYSTHIQYDILGQMVTSYMVTSPMKTIYSARIVSGISKSFVQSGGGTFIQPQKDAEYINWRYIRHPKQHYVITEMYLKSKIVGYVFAREVGVRYDVYDIITNTDPKVFQHILHAFLYFALLRGKVITSMTYLPNHFWHSVIPRLHITRRIEMYFTLKADTLSHDPSRWLIQGGDIL